MLGVEPDPDFKSESKKIVWPMILVITFMSLAVVALIGTLFFLYFAKEEKYQPESKKNLQKSSFFSVKEQEQENPKPAQRASLNAEGQYIGGLGEVAKK